MVYWEEGVTGRFIKKGLDQGLVLTTFVKDMTSIFFHLSKKKIITVKSQNKTQIGAESHVKILSWPLYEHYKYFFSGLQSFFKIFSICRNEIGEKIHYLFDTQYLHQCNGIIKLINTQPEIWKIHFKSICKKWQVWDHRRLSRSLPDLTSLRLPMETRRWAEN